MHQAWGVKHRRWLRKYWRPVSLAGGAMIAAIPVGLNQVYLAYFRALLTHRLDGMWCVADVVRQSHNPDFVGMEVKFILHLEQDSDGHLSGNGRKALVNGALPPPVEISLLAVQKGFVRQQQRRPYFFCRRQRCAPGAAKSGWHFRLEYCRQRYSGRHFRYGRSRFER
jgi:hypothetical protein